MEFCKKGQNLNVLNLQRLITLRFFKEISTQITDIFIADNQNIFNKIKVLGPNKSHYYESWSESADEIIYIDYDKE
jgi:hypothetical protein